MNKLTYSFVIAKRAEYVDLKESNDGRNPIVAVSPSGFNGDKWDVVKSIDIPTNKYIKIHDKSIVGTTLDSNSEDILVTDVYDGDEPLYYKAIIRRHAAVSIKIGGKEVIKDSNFIYTNTKSDIIYTYKDGSYEIIKDDFYPVFVNIKDFSKTFLHEIDGRAYRPVLERGRYLIHVPSSNVSFRVEDESLLAVKIFSRRQKNVLGIYVKPAYVSRVNSGYRGSNIAYSLPAPEIYIKKVENIVCDFSFGKIYFPHENISSSSVVIRLATKDMRPLNLHEYVLEKDEVFHKSGMASSEHITKMASKYGLIVLASYEYAEYSSNNKVIYYPNIRDISEIIVGITPSELTNADGEIIYSKSQIKYFVLDNAGAVIASDDGQDYSKPGLIIHPDGATGIGANTYGPANIPLFLELARVKRKTGGIEAVANNRMALPKRGSSGIRLVKKIPNSIYRVIYSDPGAPIFNAGVVFGDVHISTQSIISKAYETDFEIAFKVDTSYDRTDAVAEEVADPDVLRFAGSLNVFEKHMSKLSFFVDGRDGYKEVIPTMIKEDDGGGFLFAAFNKSDIIDQERMGVSYNKEIPGRFIKI